MENTDTYNEIAEDAANTLEQDPVAMVAADTMRGA